MKAIIQRVKQASVEVDGKIVGKINAGLLIYLGIIKGDTEQNMEKLAKKIAEFRLFKDEQNKMNLSLLQVKGEALIVSQFTLAYKGGKGNRPSFTEAAAPNVAIPLYEKFISKIKSLGIKTETGTFAAYMKVSSINDGPVTFIIEK